MGASHFALSHCFPSKGGDCWSVYRGGKWRAGLFPSVLRGVWKERTGWRVESAESAAGDGENLGERVQPAVQGPAGNEVGIARVQPSGRGGGG